MTYRIVFYDAESEIGSRLEPSDLEAAKAHAREGLILHKASSALIVDSNDFKLWTVQAEAPRNGVPPL
jgi:hypothetical protein